MKLKYFKDENTGAILAKSMHQGDNFGYAEGIVPELAWGLEDQGVVNRRALREIPSLSSWANAFEEVDDYDEEVGRAVARDKVLVKYYQRLANKYDVMADALQKMVDDYKWRSEHCVKQGQRAQDRLDDIAGGKQ